MSGNSTDLSTLSLATRFRTEWVARFRGFVFPSWAFVPLALLYLLFLVLLGLLVVVAAAFPFSGDASPDWSLARGWAVLSLAALFWALVNLNWANQAAGRFERRAANSHLAIAVGCGLIVLGIHSVLVARAIASGPIVMDYSGAPQAGGASVATAVALPEGNADEGRKIFSTSCITCHGPTGGGLPNLAPSLRGSTFIASADDATVANVIRTGRAVGTPNNKSGKVMPARGGNPFLGDDKIVHLVAFVRAIQKEGAGGAEAQASDAAPAVLLARWVVPPSPSPPSGMVPLAERADIGDAETLALRSEQRRQRLVSSTTLGLAGIHSLFLVGVMILSTSLLCRRLADQEQGGERSWWGLSEIGWVIAAVTWLAVFVLGFVTL